MLNNVLVKRDRVYFLFFLSFVCFFVSWWQFAFASGEDMIQQVFCNIILVIGGTIAQFMGVVIIIITGYLFLIGKVQMTLLFVIIGGTIMVFGAPTIMSWMTGGDVIECTSKSILDPTV